jgi:hypothetical protein
MTAGLAGCGSKVFCSGWTAADFLKYLHIFVIFSLT